MKSGENNNKNTILKHAFEIVSCHKQSVKAGFVRVDPFHDLQAHPADFTALSWKQSPVETD